MVIEPRIVLILVGFCQLDINVDISGRGNVTRILSMLWSDVQLESDIGSRGGVYIQLIRDESESPLDLRKSGPRRREAGRKVAQALKKGRQIGECVTTIAVVIVSSSYICPRVLYYNKR